MGAVLEADQLDGVVGPVQRFTVEAQRRKGAVGVTVSGRDQDVLAGRQGVEAGVELEGPHQSLVADPLRRQLRHVLSGMYVEAQVLHRRHRAEVFGNTPA